MTVLDRRQANSSNTKPTFFISTAVRVIALAVLDQKGKTRRLEVHDATLANI
jgi:hypothetical protein